MQRKFRMQRRQRLHMQASCAGELCSRDFGCTRGLLDRIRVQRRLPGQRKLRRKRRLLSRRVFVGKGRFVGAEGFVRRVGFVRIGFGYKENFLHGDLGYRENLGSRVFRCGGGSVSRSGFGVEEAS